MFEALENPALRTAYEAFTESRRRAGSDDIPAFMEWQGTPNAASGPSRDLHKAMAGKEFKNQADMLAFADQWNKIQNNRAREEFLGLSAAQMYLVFHGSPEEQEALALLDFPTEAEDLGIDPSAPPRPGAWISDHELLVQSVAWHGFEYYLRLLGLIEYKARNPGDPVPDQVRSTALFRKLLCWNIPKA